MDGNGKMRGLGPVARQWLEARGLDSELCERLGLFSKASPNGGEIVIPFERGGEVVNHKYRQIAEKGFRQDKDAEQIFWRVDCIADPSLGEEPLLITEGEMDCIAAIQAGYWRSVSVPAGAPQKAGEGRSGTKYAFIDAARAALDKAREVIIASDKDEPGAALLADLTALLGPSRCKFITYPAGCKDLNDVLKAHGVEGIRSCVNDARWVRIPGVHKLSELPPLPDLVIWRPKILPAIDKMIPVCPGHVSIWTGLAAHGKSTLVNAVMWSIAEEYDLKIGHGTFEATPQREYRDDFIAFHSGRSPIDQKPGDAERASDWLEDHVVFLNADGFANPSDEQLIDATLKWFWEAAQTAVVRHGCRIIILDPWSQIDHEMDSHEREDQYVRRFLKDAKRFARMFDVHVAIVAHPAKPKKDRDGSYEMPGGYEISGSAHWANAPELGISVHRDPVSRPVKDDDGNTTGDWEVDPKSTRVLIRIWKVKFHRSMNKPGDVYANVNSNCGRFLPAERWDES